MTKKTITKGKADKKAENRAVAIIIAVVSVILVVTILLVVLADKIAGAFKLSDFKRDIADCEEVVISMPLYFDGLNSGAETVLRGEEAELFVSELLKETEKLSFDKIVDGSEGIWDVSVSFYADEKRILHIDEEGMTFIDKKGYRYDFKEESSFYSYIEKLLVSNK